jgi:hypothetical protein
MRFSSELTKKRYALLISSDKGSALSALSPEALNAILGFGFVDLGLTRIQARCPPGQRKGGKRFLRAPKPLHEIVQRASGSRSTGLGLRGLGPPRTERIVATSRERHLTQNPKTVSGETRGLFPRAIVLQAY